MLKKAYILGVSVALEESGIKKEAALPELLAKFKNVGSLLSTKSPYVQKALEWGAAHPLASRTLAGAGLGGLSGALHGEKGDILRGTLGGAGLGAGFHLGMTAGAKALGKGGLWGRYGDALGGLIGLGVGGWGGARLANALMPQQHWYSKIIPGQ